MWVFGFEILRILVFLTNVNPEYQSTNLFQKILMQFNLLKPTGYVMHHQFNIQQLYVLPTLYLLVMYLAENKQRLVPLTE